MGSSAEDARRKDWNVCNAEKKNQPRIVYTENIFPSEREIQAFTVMGELHPPQVCSARSYKRIFTEGK